MNAWSKFTAVALAGCMSALIAGTAANAIPGTGVARGTLRLMDRAGWDQAEPLVRELVAELLAPTRVGFTLNYLRGVPPVDNDPGCTAVFRTAAEAAVLYHANQLDAVDDAPLAERANAEELVRSVHRVVDRRIF